MKTTLVLLIILLVYYFFTLYVYRRIDNSLYLDENRRRLHKKFIWIVPFLGPLIIRGFWKRRKEKKLDIMTKDKRKIDKSHFYESGKGIYGG